MEQTTYVITRTDDRNVLSIGRRRVGWPEQCLTPPLSRQAATEALRALQRRSVSDWQAYRMVPSWLWDSNVSWQEKGLSEA